MRSFFRAAVLGLALGWIGFARAQLVAPPSVDWVSLPSSASVGQTVNVGVGAHANLSDYSDGNDWNSSYAVIARVMIDLSGPSGSSRIYEWLPTWQTPAEVWTSFAVTAPGTHYITVQLMDGRPWYSDAYTYSIGVPTPAPSITSQLTVAANQGYNLSYTITATNSPTSFTASNLPAGLSLNPSTGVISGRLTAGTSTVNSTITASSSAGTDSKTLTWTITGAAITPNGSVSPSTIAIGSAVTLTRAGSANFGIGWIENTIWPPSGGGQSLGNQQPGSQSYTPTAGTGTYWYQVRIVDNSGYNYADQWISFTVTALPAPTGFQTTSVQSTAVTLSWNAVTGATGYNVYRGGVKLNSSAITGTSFTDSTAQPGSAYSYSVRAIATNGTESLPATLSVTTASPFELFTPL